MKNKEQERLAWLENYMLGNVFSRVLDDLEGYKYHTVEYIKFKNHRWINFDW